LVALGKTNPNVFEILRIFRIASKQLTAWKSMPAAVLDPSAVPATRGRMANTPLWRSAVA
jgi:hypothetical protein